MNERERLEQGLREHLKRPLPEANAERIVSAVRARLEDSRPRPALRPALVFAATGVLLAAVLAAAFWSRTAAPIAPAARPAPAPAPVVTTHFDAVDVAFGDDRHGWELGTVCDTPRGCILAVRSTDDGGHTWSSEPSRVTTIATANAAGGARIAVSGETGFVADHGLYVSRDGGRTWSDTGLAGDVVAVTPVGASTWALEGCGTAPGCPVRLLVSTDGGRTWAPSPRQPAVSGAQPVIVRVSATDAFVAGSAPTAGGTSRLAVTRDAGATWESLPDPCTPQLLGGAPAIAALEATEVWVACEAPADAPNARSVYRSRDGGLHWQLLAASGAVTIPVAPGELSLDGRITALALAPRGAAWLALGSGPLLRSPDGVTWTPSPSDIAPIHGVQRLDILDTTHGWLVADGEVLTTTDAGRSWTPLPR